MSLKKYLFLAAVTLAVLASCRGIGGQEESWRQLLSESDRLASIQEWEPATEYAIKALSAADLTDGGKSLVLCRLASLGIMTWRDAQGWEHAVQAEQLARAEGTDTLIASALLQKGRLQLCGAITEGEAQDEEALGTLREALEFASGSPNLQADILLQLSQAYIGLNRFKTPIDREIYEKTILDEKGKWCLGGYVFTWGHKNEVSPTWFGTMLPDGTKLEVVATLAKFWGGKVTNRCPRIEEVKVSKDAPAEGEVIEASVAAKDLDGDKLKWQWTLIDEASYYGEAGLGLAMPQGWDEAIVAGQGTNKVKVKLPGGGKYRLYAYCFDGKGNAAYANWPLVGKGPKPKKELRPAPVPYPVYRDGAQGVWYVSGYMGNTGAMKVDDSCAEKPHSGATCMKVSYSDNGNWAGIFWQSPANDWGDKPGGANLSKASTLVFWARGEKGGEKVSFFMGGIKNKAFSDTANRKLENVTLKKEWTRYRIPLDGEDLSQIKTGFGFNFGGQGRPFAFYLDDIEYVGD